MDAEMRVRVMANLPEIPDLEQNWEFSELKNGAFICGNVFRFTRRDKTVIPIHFRIYVYPKPDIFHEDGQEILATRIRVSVVSGKGSDTSANYDLRNWIYDLASQSLEWSKLKPLT